MGILGESPTVTEEEFQRAIDEMHSLLGDMQLLEQGKGLSFEEVSLGDTRLFTLSIGNRVLKKDILSDGVPVYSVNVSEPFGFVETSNMKDFSTPSLLWGIDGEFNWGYIPENQLYAHTDHCGVLRVVGEGILPKYLYYALQTTKNEYWFDRTLRPKLTNVKKRVSVKIPITDKGAFDVEAQQYIINRHERIDEIKQTLVGQLEALAGMQVVVDY